MPASFADHAENSKTPLYALYHTANTLMEGLAAFQKIGTNTDSFREAEKLLHDLQLKASYETSLLEERKVQEVRASVYQKNDPERLLAIANKYDKMLADLLPQALETYRRWEAEFRRLDAEALDKVPVGDDAHSDEDAGEDWDPA